MDRRREHPRIPIVPLDEAGRRIVEWLREQQAKHRAGKRYVEVHFDSDGRITKIKAEGEPQWLA